MLKISRNFYFLNAMATLLLIFIVSCTTDTDASDSETNQEFDTNSTSDTDTDSDSDSDSDSDIDSDTDSDSDSNSDTDADTEDKGLTIYFIRHAETMANVTGVHSDENEKTFSSLGLEQVSDLTDYLLEAQIDPDYIIVSPMWRTQHTILPFLISNDRTGYIWVETRECCYQDASDDPLPTEPRFKSEIIVPEADEVVLRSEDDNHMWDNETYEEGLFMVMTMHKLLMEEFSQSGKTIFIIGHYLNGNILQGLLRDYDMTIDLNHSNPAALWLQNTGVTKIVQDSSTGDFSLDGLNINNPKLPE